MNNNFKININNLNSNVSLNGWINKIRKMGDLIFVDLRGMNGIVQIVFEKKDKFYNQATKLKNDDLIYIEGKVVERKNKNKNLYSGEIEIIVNELKKISSPTIQLPILSKEKITALEQIRMKYRYLDLRRPNITKIIKFRSDYNKYTRYFFDSNNFLEIETPYLTKTTYGGASELKVSSIHHKGREYALAQSPQIYKQLLMYGGIEKYYQIAKCFRDEDSRSDRQIEFTQLDLEASFINENYIYDLIEKYFKFIIEKLFDKELKIPFKKITYQEAIEKYGTDKPDLRIDNQIVEQTNLFKKANLDFLNKKISQGKKIYSIFFNKLVNPSFIKKEQKKFKKENKRFNYIVVGGGFLKATDIKEITDDFIYQVSKDIKMLTYSLFFTSDIKENSLELLGKLRIDIAKELNLLSKDNFSFLWVTDWPLFFFGDTKENLVVGHNPFVALKEKEIKKFENLKITEKEKFTKLISRSYDLVLNGSEIAGGAIRINNYNIQNKIFKILNLNDDEIAHDFAWLLEAQKFGVPVHGGIAVGIDRVLAILLGQETIREVIAFPKTTHGTDELSGAPTLIKKQKII